MLGGVICPPRDRARQAVMRNWRTGVRVEPTTGRNMQVLLVRHALPLRSEHGEGSDPDLSEEGLAQVGRLPKALARFPISRVVSSPQRRAIQTADPVAAA